MNDRAVTYLRAAAEILSMPGGPSRASAWTTINLARLAADQVEERIGDYPDIDLGELVNATLAVINKAS